MVLNLKSQKADLAIYQHEETLFVVTWRVARLFLNNFRHYEIFIQWNNAMMVGLQL